MTIAAPTPPREPGPAWEIARLFPNQGQWEQGDYLALNRNTNRYVELSDGRIEVLAMPTKSHQRIVFSLGNAVSDFLVEGHLGEVVLAPYPVRLGDGKFREPDVVVMLAAHADRLGEGFAEGADLVVEVVSEDRGRHLDTKRKEYAKARIAEYWIVDPHEQRITVLRLARGRYVVHGEFGPGDRAESALLKGFAVDVSAVLAAGRQ